MKASEVSGKRFAACCCNGISRFGAAQLLEVTMTMSNLEAASQSEFVVASQNLANVKTLQSSRRNHGERPE